MYIGADCPTAEYVLTLAGGDQALFGSVVDKMRKLQDSGSFGLPDTRPLKGKAKGIFELRVLGGKRMFARLPFILSPQREVVLLFGETKKGAQPPPDFIDRAVRYKNKLNAKKADYEEIDFTIFEE